METEAKRITYLHGYLKQMQDQVNKLKNEAKGERAESYHSGQSLICSMVMQEIEKVMRDDFQLP